MSFGYEYRRIDGSVSAKKRQIIVREFNTDPNIFVCLISTKWVYFLVYPLDIIEPYLMSIGYEYRRIDGSVSAKKRQIIVREFNTDPNIFVCLISTK